MTHTNVIILIVISLSTDDASDVMINLLCLFIYIFIMSVAGRHLLFTWMLEVHFIFVYFNIYL